MRMGTLKGNIGTWKNCGVHVTINLVNAVGTKKGEREIINSK
jgi:hypothetical protein